MPLITADDFYERFDIDTTIDQKRITPHIGSASRRLRKWVGEGKYSQALLPEGDVGADPNLTADLKNAEAHLTYHFAIFGMNSPLSAKGVLVTAMSSEAKEVRRYLNPTETAQLSQQMLELAREIAEQYMLSDGTPTATFENVGIYEDAEASTRTNGTSCC